MAWRATSRRMGSKLETTMLSGVSSTMRSQPVAFSRARMLRPSRPMMRPFISSLGNCTTDTLVSLALPASAVMRRTSGTICSTEALAPTRIETGR